MNWVKKVGFFDAIFRAIQSIANQNAYLIVGNFYILFEDAIPIRASIAFFCTIIFDLPLSKLSNQIGNTKSLAIGSFLNSLSLFALYGAIIVDNKYTLLIISSILSGISVAFFSGSYHSFLQNFINSKCDDNQELKTKALLISQKHGKFLVSFLPTFFICILIFLYANYVDVSGFLMIPGVIYFVFGLILFFYREPSDNIVINNAVSQLKFDINKSFKRIKKLLFRKKVLFYGFIIVVANFSMIYIHTYFMISTLSNYNIFESSVIDLILICFLASSFDLAHYFKGVICSKIPMYISSDTLLIIISYFSIILLSLFTIYFYDFTESIFVLLLFILLFRGCLTLGQDIAIANYLNLFTEKDRPFFLSITLNIALLASSLYGFYLAYNQVGIEDHAHILRNLYIIMLFSLFVIFICKKKSIIS